MTKPDPWILLDEAEKRIKGYEVEKKLLYERNNKLSKLNAQLLEACKSYYKYLDGVYSTREFNTIVFDAIAAHESQE